MVRRKGATIVLQLPARRAPRLAIERHMRLLRRPAALLQVARRAGGGDIFPARPPAQPPRHDMIEGQFLARSTLLARSDERRVGKECGRKCRSRWSPYHANTILKVIKRR